MSIKIILFRQGQVDRRIHHVVFRAVLTVGVARVERKITKQMLVQIGRKDQNVLNVVILDIFLRIVLAINQHK